MAKKERRPPVPSEFEVERDGAQVAFSKYNRKATVRVDGWVANRFEFEFCPVCLGAEAVSEEHVPPRSLGGRVMTLTCELCNNRFGTAEEELRRLIELQTTARVEATDGSVPGRRSVNVAFRTSSDQGPGAIIQSGAPGADEIVSSGSGTLSVRQLNMALVSAAALKHSYIAACLMLRTVPESAGVERVRRALLAARDRDGAGLATALDDLLPHGAAPRLGWVERPDAPPVVLFTPQGEDRWMFMFGGRFTLQWPFPDVAPDLPERPAAVDPTAESAVE